MNKMIMQYIVFLVGLLQGCASFAMAFQQPAIPVNMQQQNTCAKNRLGQHMPNSACRLSMTSSSSSSVRSLEDPTSFSTTATPQPQAMASGYSQSMDMKEAIREAVQIALEALPPPLDETAKIDLAVVSISSLYDGNASPSEVVPAVLEAAKSYGKGIQHLVGSTCGGYIGSRATFQRFPPLQAEENDDEDDEKKKKANAIRACKPVEQEGVPGVSVVLSVLPDVELQTFHVLGNDVPDDYGRVSTEVWRQAIGLSSQDTSQAVFLLPSPAFSKDLDDLLRGFENHFPETTVFGAVASTVSSLSRARLFRHDVNEKGLIQTMADGCVGVVMSGDIEVKTMVAQGAKPVGGVYQIVKGEESTISAIALDETATELVRQAEALDEDGDLDEDDNDDGDDEFAEFRIAKSEKAAQMAAAYAKARIPKPVLAEANFLMKTLSDDDQAFMRKTLLVGLERGGALGRTPSELARLAEGKGHSFTVHQVASAAMKEGSVTLSLGSVNIKSGTRMRFFVREADFARKEVEALWMGYKKRALSATLKGEENPFVPSGCLLFPTLDRGNKFFLGKPGFESLTASQFLPTVSCISGFFSNGVIGVLDTDEELAGSERATLSGSASGYVLIGSKSARPVFTPTKESSDKAVKGNTNNNAASAAAFDTEEKAPRDENGELILKRREVHSGRALTVSTVEWSVAEKTAYPTSKLEGFMWDKETEVDRFRERVPLANLLSQCKLGAVDPTKPKPRNWISPVKKASKDGQFVIIPECKRSEPGMGSLRKRYDLRKLAKDFTTNGAPAMSVNCDGVLFGGSLEDLTKAREASSKAKLESATPVDDNNLPPILASDLILYPYQLYKMRLAGADAVNLLVGALAAKDLVYLTKIAKSVQMQSLLTVTSAAQLEKVVTAMDAGTVDGLIVSNRELEDFSFDMTGQQALNILQSDAMKFFQEKHPDAPILVDGRVGIIEAPDSMSGTRSRKGYIEQLKEAGATGAIIGGGLVGDFASDLSSFVL